jgi:hypothetical protein
MVWLFVICAAIVVVGVARWVFKERETIRRYRDHIATARAEAARRERQ